MKKYVFTFAIVVVVLIVFSATKALAVQCTNDMGCNYTSTSIFCSNGSCGPGWCRGVQAWDCTVSCPNGGTCGPTAIICSSCTPPCTPVCNAPFCGQSNGCGGTCSSSDVGNWTKTGFFCDPGCGTQQCYDTWEDPCGNWQWTPAGTNCTECGPTYGAWGACSAPTGQRSRTVSYNCQAGQTETENCLGSIYGTIFDASVVNDCASYATQPAVVGAGVTATATVNHSTVYSTTTNSSGNYTRSGLRVPDTYNLGYTVDTSQWIASPPKLLCDGALTGISLSTQGQTVRRRIGLWRIYGGWFQAQGGDISAEQGISVVIPGTCVLPANQASCGSFDQSGTTYTPLVRDSIPASGTGDPGLVFAPTISLDTAPNAVNSSNRRAALTGYAGRTFDYGYYFAQTGRLVRQDWDGVGKPTGSPTGEIFKSSGTVTISSDWNLGSGGDERMMILHDGDVNITSDMNVAQGSYLSIIASGTITFASNVVQAEGVYIANTISIASTGDELTEQQFVGEGTFVGWSGVQLNRDRGVTNNTAPAELFIFRPDFVINAASGMRVPEIRWQEIPS